MVKNLPDNVGDVRDVGSTPGSGRSSGGGGTASQSSILAQRVPRTEEPSRLQSVGHKELDTTKAT